MWLLALLSCCIWLYLCCAHGRFWQSGPELAAATPVEFPVVDIIVPARDEAETIGPVIESLLSQDYAGKFSVLLVDDGSSDDTAARAGSAPNLRVLRGQPKPDGWSGKLWAVQQGVASSSAPLLLFTDADIVHDRLHLASLVARLLSPPVEMVSEMVLLNCRSLAERVLIPAFVYFFQMLYPFARVNAPASAVAAAAGGTILIRRATLERTGGIASIRNALIDDIALAAAVKKHGPIYLGHSGLAVSIRQYPDLPSVWRMIARTAFTQLRNSAVLLVLTLIALAIVWLAPIWIALFGRSWVRGVGLLTCVLAAMTYLPTLRRYRLAPWLVVTLPFVAVFYMSATLGSAINHWCGRGVSWKRRAYETGSQ